MCMCISRKLHTDIVRMSIQINALESAQANQEILKAMQSGAKAMKTANNNMYEFGVTPRALLKSVVLIVGAYCTGPYNKWTM